MKQKKTPTPHDNLFRSLFEEKEKAAELIQFGLPPKIVKKLKLETLRKTEEVFVDPQQTSFQADIVYECTFEDDHPVWVSLLFEHKSQIPRNPYLQLLKYMVGIWDKQFRNNEPLRPILPIIFYHGQQEWKQRDFGSYFEGGKIHPDLRPFTPEFNFWLINLAAQMDQTIVDQISTDTLRIAMLLMKHIGSPNILDHLTFIFEEDLQLFSTESGRRQLDIFYLYLINGTKKSPETIRAAMKKIPHFETVVGSTAWQMEQEAMAKGMEKGIVKGMEKGREEGRQEAEHKLALKLLRSGFPIDEVCSSVGLSIAEVEKLQEQNQQ